MAPLTCMGRGCPGYASGTRHLGFTNSRCAQMLRVISCMGRRRSSLAGRDGSHLRVPSLPRCVSDHVPPAGHGHSVTTRAYPYAVIHIHSHFPCAGFDTIDMCDAAIENGIQVVASRYNTYSRSAHVRIPPKLARGYRNSGLGSYS